MGGCADPGSAFADKIWNEENEKKNEKRKKNGK